MTNLVRWPEKESDHHKFASEYLRYDHKTGDIFWRVNRLRAKSDDVAGNLMSNGYIQIELAQTNHRAHRIAWLLFYGEWPSLGIDHINGDRSDNRIVNLRIADQQTNARNIRLPKDNTSGVIGVSWCKDRKKWAARIKASAHGPYKHLGRFDLKSQAVDARRRAEKKYGFHPNHGKPISQTEGTKHHGKA